MLYAKYLDAVKYKSQDRCNHFLDRVIFVIFNTKTEEKSMRGIQHRASMRYPITTIAIVTGLTRLA